MVFVDGASLHILEEVHDDLARNQEANVVSIASAGGNSNTNAAVLSIAGIFLEARATGVT